MDLSTLGIEIGLGEYFKYHPPTTDARKQAHNIVNDSAFGTVSNLLELAVAMEETEGQVDILNEQGRKININENFIEYNLLLVDAQKIVLDYMADLKAVVKDGLCLEYIMMQGNALLHVLKDKNLPLVATQKAILMYVQQMRMFGNQGVTVDEIVASLESDKPKRESIDPAPPLKGLEHIEDD